MLVFEQFGGASSERETIHAEHPLAALHLASSRLAEDSIQSLRVLYLRVACPSAECESAERALLGEPITLLRIATRRTASASASPSIRVEAKVGKDPDLRRI